MTKSTMQSTTNLLEQGQRLLRIEARRTDAQIVDALRQAVAMSQAGRSVARLTAGEVAHRIGVSRTTAVKWVKKGLFPGVRLGEPIFLAPDMQQRSAQQERALDDLDAERQSSTYNEAVEIAPQISKSWAR